MVIFTHCQGPCGLPLRTVAYANPNEPAAVIHHGHGMCKPCWRFDGKTPAEPRRARPDLTRVAGATRGGQRKHVAEEFAYLVESIGGVRTSTALGWDKRTRFKVAERLGMSVDALDKALYRAAA